MQLSANAIPLNSGGGSQGNPKNQMPKGYYSGKFTSGSRRFEQSTTDILSQNKELGNPSRKFNFLTDPEARDDLSQALSLIFTRSLWYGHGIIGRFLLPSMEVQSGTTEFTMTTLNHNIEPTTPLPELGVPRLMSFNEDETTSTIAAEGIAARLSEKQVTNDKRLDFFKMNVEGFTFSIELRQELGRFGAIVNAADENSTMGHQPMSTTARHRYLLARDLEVFAANGDMNKDVSILVSNLFQNNPQMDTIVVAGSAAAHYTLGTGISYAIPLYEPMFDDSDEFDGLMENQEDNLEVQTIGSIAGRPVVSGPIFRKAPNTRGYDPLRSVTTIGEVYNDRTDIDFRSPNNQPYTQEYDSVKIFDEPNNESRVMYYADGLEHSFIWDIGPDGGYHALLKQYVSDLNNNVRVPDVPEHSMPVVFPVSRRDEQFYLPKFVGAIDSSRLSRSLLNEMVECNGPAPDDMMRQIDHLRQKIEALKPDAKSLELIVRANIGANIVKSETGEPTFNGSITPSEITRTQTMFKFDTLNEWQGQEHGGLVLPDGANPIGFWSAAGLEALADSNHKWAGEAQMARDFLSRVTTAFDAKFENSVLLQSFAHPPNIHNVTQMQNIMTAIWGARAPLTLAAPTRLIAGSVAQEARSPPAERTVTIGGQEYRVKVNAGEGRGAQYELVDGPANPTIFETPEGVIFSVDEDPQNMPLKSSVTSEIKGLDWINTVAQNNAAELFSDVEERETYKNDLKTVIIESLERISNAKGIENHLKTLLAIVEDNGVNKLDLINKAFFNKDRNEALNTRKEYAGRGLANPERYENTLDSIRRSKYTKLTSDKRAEVDRNVERAESLKEAADAFLQTYKSANPGSDVNPNGYFVSLNPGVEFDGRTNLLELDTSGMDQNVQRAKDALEQVASTFRDQSFFGLRVQPFIQGDLGDPEAPVTTAELSEAQHFRSPLFATKAIAEKIESQGFGWVKIMDPESSFNTVIEPRDYGRLDDYNLLAPASRIPIANYADFSGRSKVDPLFALTKIAFGGDAQRIIEDDPGDLMSDAMRENVAHARRMSRNNWAKLLMAFGTLLIRQDSIGAVESAIRNGILLPQKPLYWRPVSRHYMGDAVVMKRGPETGFVPYTDAHINAGLDTSRREMLLRAEVATGTVIRQPRNITFLGPVTPLGYIGGHGSDYVTSERDLMNNELQNTPSVFFTLIGRDELKQRSYPLSFVNDVPGSFDVSNTNNPRDPSPVNQYFSGAQYYSQYVYPRFFAENNRRTFGTFDTSAHGRESFNRRGFLNEHVCWGGFYEAWDPITRSFSIHKRGNGHRPTYQLNSPGAFNYWNGISAMANPEVSSTLSLGKTVNS